MNQKEINELRRRFRADRSNISRIYGCFVNTKKEIVAHIDSSLGMMKQEEAEIYLTWWRRRSSMGASTY